MKRLLSFAFACSLVLGACGVEPPESVPPSDGVSKAPLDEGACETDSECVARGFKCCDDGVCVWTACPPVE